MGLFLLLTKLTLFFLIIFASFSCISVAGGRSKFMVNDESTIHIGDVYKGSRVARASVEIEDQVVNVGERILMMNTNDYERYDPSPSFSRPRHKLIPN